VSDEGFAGAQPVVEPVVESVLATIAFGSNLGTREAHLNAGREALLKSPGVGFVAASRVYQTPPVGPAGQGPYLNAVVRVRTRLEASALLARMLMIEREQGRVRAEVERWSARTLDLDLLLYGERRIADRDLIVPHPRLHERAFVLAPLCDIASGERHPVLGRRFESLLGEATDRESVALASWQFDDPLPQ
jgi:2-amino-4-hydroxy-6-hydroxymethyldihydropteridine diphosphokinase